MGRGKGLKPTWSPGSLWNKGGKPWKGPKPRNPPVPAPPEFAHGEAPESVGPEAGPGTEPFARAPDGGLWFGPWQFDELPLRLRIDPPLALGLEVQQSTHADMPRGDGDLEFWAWHIVRADDPARAEAFLHPDFRKVLLTVRPWYHLVLDDHSLVLRWRPSSSEREAHMRAAYRQLASEIDRGRTLVAPVEAALSLVPAWEALAKKRGLTMWHSPLGIGGRVGEAYVRAGVWPSRRDWAFRFSVRRDAPIGLGLSLERAGLGQRISAPFRKGHKADRDVGEKSFDEAFDVRSTSPELLPAVLDAPARAAVRECAAVVPALRLHDHGAEGEGRGDIAWAAKLPRFVDDVIDFVELLARNAATGGTPAAQGPYR